MAVEAWAAWAYEYVMPLVGLIVVALLFDIRSKLEAIRLMMVRYFDEKYAPRYVEDSDLRPPG
jgi:hypothetical protein